MNVRTIEDNFEYQAKEVFNDMLEDYQDEQNERKADGDEIQTFRNGYGIIEPNLVRKCITGLMNMQGLTKVLKTLITPNGWWYEL